MKPLQSLSVSLAQARTKTNNLLGTSSTLAERASEIDALNEQTDKLIQQIVALELDALVSSSQRLERLTKRLTSG